MVRCKVQRFIKRAASEFGSSEGPSEGLLDDSAMALQCSATLLRGIRLVTPTAATCSARQAQITGR